MSLVSPSPALANGFKNASAVLDQPSTMTLQGAVRRTWIVLALAVCSGIFAGVYLPDAALIALLIPAVVLGLVTAFRPALARYTAVPYALLEGGFAGLVSRWYAQEYGSSIVVWALGITVAIFAALLGVYSLRLIKVTENFRLALAAATGGIALFYLAAFVASFFGVTFPLIASSSTFGIAFSVFVVVIASANLVTDFDFIERGAEASLPRHMEWFAAFGLLVTLVWLYLELLRLLAKLQRR